MLVPFMNSASDGFHTWISGPPFASFLFFFLFFLLFLFLFLFLFLRLFRPFWDHADLSNGFAFLVFLAFGHYFQLKIAKVVAITFVPFSLLPLPLNGFKFRGYVIIGIDPGSFVPLHLDSLAFDSFGTQALALFPSLFLDNIDNSIFFPSQAFSLFPAQTFHHFLSEFTLHRLVWGAVWGH